MTSGFRKTALSRPSRLLTPRRPRQASPSCSMTAQAFFASWASPGRRHVRWRARSGPRTRSPSRRSPTRLGLLLPFSLDRNLLAAALASPDLARVANSSQSFIYQAAYLTAHELFSGRSGRKAIVLLTDGQDSGLGLTWDPASMHARPGTAGRALAFDDVARELASQGVALYVISTEGRPRAMTAAWLAEHRSGPIVTPDARKLGIPEYTLYLAEMVRQVGGDVYFLRRGRRAGRGVSPDRACRERRVYAWLLSRGGNCAAGLAGTAG